MKGRRIGLFLFFLCLMGVIGFVFLRSYIVNKNIKENSIRVESVLVESDGHYTKVHEEDDDYGTSYDMDVYQYMKVEFELNGKNQTVDMGLVKIDEYSASSWPSNEEIKAAEKRVVYGIGDVVEVYVDRKGQVYLASAVDDRADGSTLVVAGVVIGITTLLAAPMFIRRKRRA